MSCSTHPCTTKTEVKLDMAGHSRRSFFQAATGAAAMDVIGRFAPLVQLGLYALTSAAPTEPGAPLCRAHSDTPALDGLELVLKGGQVGSENFFEHVRLGLTDA
jgi:uncharacterized protein YgbK (DUF1537 family)